MKIFHCDQCDHLACFETPSAGTAATRWRTCQTSLRLDHSIPSSVGGGVRRVRTRADTPTAASGQLPKETDIHKIAVAWNVRARRYWSGTSRAS